MIKKPHFYKETLNGERISEYFITEQDFDLWLNQLLENAVRVYGWGKDYDWCPSKEVLNKNITNPSQQALLINIEPIKTKTREEKLEDILKEICGETPLLELDADIWDKAEKLLKEKQK